MGCRMCPVAPRPPFQEPPAMRRALLMVFVGSCAFMGGAAIVGLTSRVESLAADPPSLRLPRPTSDVLQIGDRFEIVARKVSPAVVYIEATKPAGTSEKSRPV